MILNSTYFLIFKRLGLVLLAYLAARLLFVFFNNEVLIGANFQEILAAFWLGFRFDISTVLSINILYVALASIPILKWQENAKTQQYLKWLFVFGNAPFLLMTIGDMELFAFTGRRSNASVFLLSADAGRMLSQILENYWYIFLITVLMSMSLWLLYPVKTKSLKSITWKLALPINVLIIAFSILGIRGGVQTKPLMPGHAFTLHPSRLGNVALNTPFIVFKTMNEKELYPRITFMSDNDANALATIASSGKGLTHYPKQNICIIILESFSPEYIGYVNNGKGYTPFLDSLSRVGVYFDNAFANGTRSIEAVPSITAALPNLFEESFISSQFTQNKVLGLPAALGDKGYSSAFFHGGNNGTMGFDYFAGMAGFDKYYGRNEYGLMNDYDGNWGIFDEPFLQYTTQKMDEMNAPFLTTIFTLSSHQPFTIPDKYKDKFPKGTLPIHEAIAYTDFSLRAFFETAKRKKWYKNTLFILTADHTTISDNPKYASDVEKFRVPIILFQPAGKLPKLDTHKVVQHADITPSVLDYLNISPKETMKIGRSFFASGDNPTVQMLNGHYYCFTRNGYCTINDQNVKEQFLNTTTPAADSINATLAAQVQYFNHGMLDNSWYSSQASKK